jgi:hypothetical protein
MPGRHDEDWHATFGDGDVAERRRADAAAREYRRRHTRGREEIMSWERDRARLEEDIERLETYLGARPTLAQACCPP